jgi:hypothetical protein
MSGRRSVSGVPCKMVVWGDAGRLWVWVNDTEAAGGLCVCQCEAREWGLSRKPETERSWLGLGCTV